MIDLYCINLARRTDRREAMSRWLPQWPFGRFHWWPAVDAWTSDPPRCWADRPRGAWGCYTSHLSLLDHVVSRRQTTAICEDDIRPRSPDIWHAVERIIDEYAWDWLYLAGRPRWRQLAAGFGEVRRNNCAACYVVTPRAASVAAARLRERPGIVDHVYSRLHTRGIIAAHAMHPSPFIGVGSRSDIRVALDNQTTPV